jgi:hypothetical protein
MLLRGQTGTVHVEGVLIHGPGLGDGIDLDQRKGAIVQIQHVRVEYAHAQDQRRFTDTHPDVIQTWAGPRELRVDGLTGCTGYQGFFLHPTQLARRARLEAAAFSRINITGTNQSRYLLWQHTPFPITVEDVWVRPRPRASARRVLWPSPAPWRGVRLGPAPQGDFVPRDAVGTAYATTP